MLAQIVPLSMSYILVAAGVNATRQAARDNEWLWLLVWIPLAVLVILVAPYKLWKKEKDELDRLTDKHLFVSCHGIYYDGHQHWLRLQVENQSALPISGCYGKLVRRRLLEFSAVLDGEKKLIPLSREVGEWSRPGDNLPPEGYRFPWSPTAEADTLISIPGNCSQEYLYIAVKSGGTDSFGFASRFGVEYTNRGVGRMALDLEIGSEAESLKPTRVRLTFAIGAPELEFICLTPID